MKKEKIESIEILRGIGVLAVIAIHITATCFSYPIDSKTHLIYGILNKFCGFAVPLFLFISAFVLMKGTKERGTLKIGEFYLKRFKKTVLPYFVWTIIYLLYLKFNGTFLGIKEPKLFIKYFFLGGAYYHLYFMPVIIQLYLVFPIIWLFCRGKESKLSGRTNFIVTFLVIEALQFFLIKLNYTFILPHFKLLAVMLSSYILPVGIGFWLGYNFDKWKMIKKSDKIVLFILTLCAGYFFIKRQLFIDWGVPIYTMQMLYSTLICLSFLILSDWLIKSESFLKSFLLKISKQSFFIYLIHPLILNIFTVNLSWAESAVTKSAFANYTIDFVCKYVLVLFISYGIAQLKGLFFCRDIKKSI